MPAQKFRRGNTAEAVMEGKMSIRDVFAEDSPLGGALAELRAYLDRLNWYLGQIKRIVVRYQWQALLSLVFIGLIFEGTAPLRRDEFTYLDLQTARLYLALSPIPIVISVFLTRSSRFELRPFQINAPRPTLWSRWRKPMFTTLALALCALVYVTNPLGVYVSGHTKAIVQVFYVTDRQPTISSSLHFTNEPSAGGSLSYGIGSFPITWTLHDIGIHSNHLFSWKRDSIILEHFQTDQFFDRAYAASQASFNHDALLFVHGFKNPFEDALSAAAKLTYDLKFNGATILYSWPSGDEKTSYLHDSDNADWSVKHLRGVLLTLATLRGVQRLHLIAHSMGSRVLGKAIDALDSGVASGSFTNVIFAAPDIDKATFEQISAAVRHTAGRTTVYVSTWDGALATSSALHKAWRVGLVPMRWDGMDVVDTGGKDTSAGTLKHSYLFDSQPVLYDLFMVTEGIAPRQRVGVVATEDGCCWRFEHR